MILGNALARLFTCVKYNIYCCFFAKIKRVMFSQNSFPNKDRNRHHIYACPDCQDGDILGCACSCPHFSQNVGK